MNKDLLGKCRVCGQMISKNLATDVYGHSKGCPHCGETRPHSTEEDERRIKEEREHNLIQSLQERQIKSVLRRILVFILVSQKGDR